MNAPFLNLFPWRETQAKQRLQKDIGLTIFGIGLLGLLCEISLMLININSWHQGKEALDIQHTISKQHAEWTKATRANNQLKKLTNQLNEQKIFQQSWENVNQMLHLIAEKQSNRIQLKKIVCENARCILDGESSKPEEVAIYQKEMGAMGYHVELSSWAVNNPQSATFQLQVGN